MKSVNVVLFDNFTTLDAVGPTEVFAKLNEIYEISYLSEEGGFISSSTGAAIQTRPLDGTEKSDILLVPGGLGTRTLVNDSGFLGLLKNLVTNSQYLLSVCTGSALLAKAGSIDGRKATSNKLAWDWVVAQSGNVKWIRNARWVVDGNYYSSSGITAGIDMTLGFISDMHDHELARKIGTALEYLWNEDRNVDPFA